MIYLMAPGLVLAAWLWVRGYWLGVAAAFAVLHQLGAFYDDPQWARPENVTFIVFLAYAALCAAPALLWRAVGKPPPPLRATFRTFKRNAEAPRGISRQAAPGRLSVVGGIDQR